MNRKQMETFLKDHFRYNTMNSWNRATSYAAKVKIYSFVPSELQDKAFELLDAEGWQYEIQDILREFDERHGHRFQIGQNGRSGGYYVLYQGGEKPSEYKSHCLSCGQRNFSSVKATGKKCGVCHADERVDYEKPPVEVYTQPGLGLDGDAEFYEWTIEELKSRVKLVKDFDKTIERAKRAFIGLCKSAKIEDHEIHYTKTVKRVVME